MGMGVFESVHGAGEWLSECGVLKRDVVGDFEGVFGDDALGDADELGIGAVIEEEIVAEVFLAAIAEVAVAAGGGVECHYAVTGGELGDAFPGLYDGAGKLVSEERWGHDHAGMVAAAEDFKVSTAGKGRANADDQFPGQCLRHRDSLNANVFATVEDGGPHGSVTERTGGLERITTDLNDLFDSVSADDKDFTDGVLAHLDDVSNGIAANFDYIFDRCATASECALYRVWHRFLLAATVWSRLRFCYGCG
jgi:hypothetical protein